MTDPGRDEAQVGRSGPALDTADFFRIFITVHLAVGPAEPAVHRIDIADFFRQFRLGHIIIEIAAKLCRQSQFTITERAGTAPAADDVAHFILGQSLRIAARGNPFADILPLFHHKDLVPFICQLQSRKNPGRTGTDNNDIIIFYSFHQFCLPNKNALTG